MPIDVARARALTPGCDQVLHFNNAGAGLMPLPVLNAMKAHLDLEARIGGYEAAAAVAAEVEGAYDALAALLNCTRDELAVTENATRAWEMAFHAVPLGPGDRVLTGHAEYVSNWLAMLLVRERTGCTVDVVPNGPDGAIDTGALRRMLDERVKLVAITHVASSNGLINPAEEVGRVVRGSDALYLLDACQSAGQLPLDVEAIGCDMLSATARKFLRGPRGTGFLYVRKQALERLRPPFADLLSASWDSTDHYTWRPDARRFETWEKSIAQVVGLAAAVDHALEHGMDAITERTRGLAATLREALTTVPGATVRDTGTSRSGIVTFTLDGHDPDTIQHALGARGINIAVGRREFARLDMEPRGLDKVLRASPHYYNTEEEVERFVRELPPPR